MLKQSPWMSGGKKNLTSSLPLVPGSVLLSQPEKGISGDFSRGVGGCEQPGTDRPERWLRAGELLGGQFGGLLLPGCQGSVLRQGQSC